MGVLTVLATVGPFIYIYVEKKAEDKLLREQRSYQNTLRKASGGMIRVRDLNKLLNLIVHILTRTVKIEFASIHLFDSDSNQYKMAAKKDRLGLVRHFTLDNKSVIIEYLRLKKEAIVYEEVQLQSQDSPQDAKLADLEKHLQEIKAAVIVPSFVGNKLLGFLVLGRKNSGKIYSQDDLNVFSVLANQMALAIENAISHEEIRDTRSQLMQLEKLAMTGKLANTVAHELRNPLTAIKTFTEYLDQNYDNKEFRDKFRDVVNSELDRLQDITSQLLDTAKIAQPHFKDKVDAHRIIEATVLLLEKELSSQGIRWETKLNAQKSLLKADTDQLKQCFLNLIINSIQALQHKPGTDKRIIVSTDNPDEERLLIEITDTGRGIPEADIAHIFEPFFTTKDKGTGLGLSIVEGIILAHNGKISCQSQVNKGATFIIELPLAKR
jgi:signal transduction histidine kinase